MEPDPTQPGKYLESFMAASAALIPTGEYRGRVLVWDNDGRYPPSPRTIRPTDVWVQRWAIVDPDNIGSTTGFTNKELSLPAGQGDLYCAGHGWTSRGNLVVAGGNRSYDDPRNLVGSTMVYVFYPAKFVAGMLNDLWERQPDLDFPRWYPSVVLWPIKGTSGRDRVLILGGMTDTPSGTGFQPLDDYQAFRPSGAAGQPGDWQAEAGGGEVFSGPSSAVELGNYPRMLLVYDAGTGTGYLARVGQGTPVDLLHHDPASGSAASWTTGLPMPADRPRLFGTAVPAPLLLGVPAMENRILVLGGTKNPIPNGTDPPTAEILDTVESFRFFSSQQAWTTETDLVYGRRNHLSVLYPDGSIIVVGGVGLYAQRALRYRYDATTSSWVCELLPPSAARHAKHAIAILLPDGRILLAGGDGRGKVNGIWADYEILLTPNIPCDPSTPRPVIVDPDPTDWQSYRTMTYGGTGYLVDYDYAGDPAKIAKVVLVAPGAVTHSWDGNQRVVELSFTNDTLNTTLAVDAPAAGREWQVPPGVYMLFLLTDDGVLCQRAAWVELQ